MEGYFYSIYKDSASIVLINDTDEKRRFGSDWPHYSVLHRVLNFMITRGFEVGRDPEIQKHYKILNKDHWYGRKKDLEFKAERYPRGFKIEFFQNVAFENRYGGFHDFDKFEKMPYLIKLLWINETKKISEFLDGLEIKDDTGIEYKLAKDKIKKHLVDSWHHPQKDMSFNLSDLEGTTCEYKFNNTDRDKKTIYNGQIKYFRNYKGRLMRGQVYHNINNMWWVILNDTEYTNIADFELFDATAEDFKNRRIQRNAKDAFETSTKAARGYFAKKGLSYNDIKRSDIEKLHEIVGKEIDKGSCIETMKINPKIRTRCKSNKKIVHAYLYVDAHYFTKRECISFNPDGFIGFAGWAGSETVRPIIKGFIKWCDYLTENRAA